MPLDPAIKGFLDATADAAALKSADLPIAVVRTRYARYALMAGEGPAMESVTDATIEGPAGAIAVRIFRPAGGTRAALVWLHGGGWAVGDLDTDDTRCRQLAARAEVVVISVDYRLSPEHVFPAAVDDSAAAVAWVIAHAADYGVDPTRVAVGGDSAGGNLSAVVCQVLRDRGGAIPAFQLLVYPVADAVGPTPGAPYPSMVDNGVGYFLTKETMDWAYATYAGGVDAADPRLSPMRAASLADLPPAFVLTAEFDPLRDEGEAYAGALRAAGVSCANVRYEGLIHGFFGMENLFPAAKVGMDDAVSALRIGLGLQSADLG